MNKKYMMFSLFGLLALAMVGAAVLPYLGQVQTDVTVDSSFVFVGDDTTLANVAGGEEISSDDLMISSQTSAYIPLDIYTTPTESGVVHTEEYILSASGAQGTDSGIFVTAEDAGVTGLDDLDSISWDVNVLSGYISHVDVLIDTDGDGIADDALVFEYAKVAAPFDNAPDYPIGEVDTFGDKGVIDDNAIAWLTSEDAGPVGGAGYTAYTLADWKLGQTSNKNAKVIPADVTVIGFDFEVDNWVVDSESDLSNVLINGNSVELTLKPGESLDFRVLTEFGLLNAGDYTITTTVDVR